MASPGNTTEHLKEEVRHELIELGINVFYVALVFASFTQTPPAVALHALTIIVAPR